MFEFKMPKMGESISEATIISWLKNVGDFVEAEETILEVATDKVDSEVSAPVSGVITEIRFQKDDVVEVGTVLALIDTEGVQEATSQKQEVVEKSSVKPSTVEVQQTKTDKQKLTTNPNAFISPLIISIAQKENLSIEELQIIQGSGAE
jgi:2-oxoglutarate dehydrogenase E2 component (dihydrolipoamide succinyltransferase)